LYSINRVNTPFSTINANFTFLLHEISANYRTRLVARSEDGVIRFISPVSGKVLAMSLPLLEMDKTVDFDYSPQIGRIITTMTALKH
jgi:hypothetical protein